MELLSKQQLAEIAPKAKGGIDVWYAALDRYFSDYSIDSVDRLACFLAQTTHESGGFTVLEESLNYSVDRLAAVWPARFSDPNVARMYAHNPERLANYVYANRMGNGGPESGDGFRFRGSGIIQLTGRANMTKFARAFGITLESAPDLLKTVDGAVLGACWFWSENNLNALADARDHLRLTKKINGGILGLDDRIAKFYKIVKVLNQ